MIEALDTEPAVRAVLSAFLALSVHDAAYVTIEMRPIERVIDIGLT